MTISDTNRPYIVDNNNINIPLSRDLSKYPNGIIISINKPLNWTSADVVRKVKFSLQRFFSTKNIKVGHAGTLDPLATGILLICIGKATKLADILQSQVKEYIATIQFGATTPSYDLETPIDQKYPFEHINTESINRILPELTGEIDQIPPIFSAKLIDGNRAYELARAGIQKELKASKITIYNLEIIKYISPDLTIAIKCSKGTYIRSFARDLGLSLDSGAHLTALIRSCSGDFYIQNSVSLDQMKLFIE